MEFTQQFFVDFEKDGGQYRPTKAPQRTVARVRGNCSPAPSGICLTGMSRTNLGWICPVLSDSFRRLNFMVDSPESHGEIEKEQQEGIPPV